MIKEQTKTHIPREGMENDATQDKMKGNSMINPKFNVTTIKNKVIMLMNIKVPLTVRKGKSTILKRKINKKLLYYWHLKEKMRRKTHYILTSKQNHKCGFKNMFAELNELKSCHVYFEDASKILVNGKDKIIIHLKHKKHQFISNVYHVPNMKNNILSLGQLLKK